ncbi:hypothetical protein [Rhodonellum sp.]|uniref:hypothetical protein n=1 Tax=Rhodonellum sp. TaxID=2231180 RepID=UPI00272033AE|nr:hypothetical protein [Rhodonellum sp.]MDO9551101.1 hypothetical protein [Rhodonellum sp.]
MKKFLLGSIFWLALLTHTADAQEYHSRWIFISEFSPSFPTDKAKILENPYQSQSLEWRNSLGMRIFGEMFIGFNVTFRSYNQKETAIYPDNEPSGITSTYNYNLENKLFGMGPFITKFFEVSPNFYLTATVLANLEQGRGKQSILKDTNCQNCFENTSNVNFTGESNVILNREFKELVLYGNAEVGLIYLINPSLAVNANLMLFRYERNSSRSGKSRVDDSRGAEVDRKVNVSNRGISHVMERPILRIGIVIPLGLWESRY